jgi:hypothetical protein
MKITQQNCCKSKNYHWQIINRIGYPVILWVFLQILLLGSNHSDTLITGGEMMFDRPDPDKPDRPYLKLVVGLIIGCLIVAAIYYAVFSFFG